MGRLQVGPKNGELAVTTVVFAVLVKLIRGPIELKNVQKYGKSPKGGGGVSTKNQKSKIRNLDFLIRNVNKL